MHSYAEGGYCRIIARFVAAPYCAALTTPGTSKGGLGEPVIYVVAQPNPELPGTPEIPSAGTPQRHHPDCVRSRRLGEAAGQCDQGEPAGSAPRLRRRIRKRVTYDARATCLRPQRSTEAAPRQRRHRCAPLRRPLPQGLASQHSPTDAPTALNHCTHHIYIARCSHAPYPPHWCTARSQPRSPPGLVVARIFVPPAMVEFPTIPRGKLRLHSQPCPFHACHPKLVPLATTYRGSS